MMKMIRIVNKNMKKQHFRLWNRNKEIWIKMPLYNLILLICCQSLKARYLLYLNRSKLNKNNLLHTQKNSKISKRWSLDSSLPLRKWTKTKLINLLQKRKPILKKVKNHQGYFNTKMKPNKLKRSTVLKIISRNWQPNSITPSSHYHL